MSAVSQPVTITWLSGPDIAQLAMTDAGILDAVEAGLAAQGKGETVIEPRPSGGTGGSARSNFSMARTMGFIL